MTRRNFLSSILQAGAAFSILPSALLYQRKWKASQDSGLIVPEAPGFVGFKEFSTPLIFYSPYLPLYITPDIL